MNASRLTRRRVLTLAGLGLVAGPAFGQGFAGLGRHAGEFAVPRPETQLSFPADHAPHPDFRIEWWYVTANLNGPDGTPYGVQWTLFRSALTPASEQSGWSTTQAWMGHAALTTPDRHFAAERLARGGIGQAGAGIEPFDAWIDDWRLSGPDLDHVTMKAAGEDFAFTLDLATEAAFVLQGNNGFSVKSAAGQASHYYSQPFYEVAGTLRFEGREISVTGLAWLDREWSSQPLSGDQEGWDWFSLHLEGGDKLMGFRLRGSPDFTAATYVSADGTTTAFENGVFSAEPMGQTEIEGRDIPVRWQVRLPPRGIDVTVAALNANAWMPLTFPYWEGPVTIEGSHSGQGYLEMTGYE
ncbi:lipocalin-like domain-containing protein [Palleronia sp. LCG004]|uniref:lipocalin-like domain-containing protein n=1 Tax=Palleronia sp. LCG004 TaxID=3079304 RepID=UPI0029421843|nr:lipocalin-like domain-containing protein [Palleronia sp. LCG004]WOI55045.1 lipocalin-like domain-containing protein [Palleronia sp. LCG004]